MSDRVGIYSHLPVLTLIKHDRSLACSKSESESCPGGGALLPSGFIQLSTNSAALADVSSTVANSGGRRSAYGMACTWLSSVAQKAVE